MSASPVSGPSLEADRPRVTRQTSRVALAAAAVGGAVGVLAEAFRFAVEQVAAGMAWLGSGSTTGSAIGWIATTVVGALLAVASYWLVRRFAPEAGGSGVQEIEGALAGERPVRWRRVIPTKFASASLALGGGMALGREGPTVQMGGSVGAMLSETFRFDDGERHVLIAAGAAAGLAAAFNAPLAGAIFIMEEMRPHFRFGFLSFQSVLVASVSADVVTRAISGQAPVLATSALAAPLLASLPLFLVYGALLGVLAVAFSRSILALLDVRDRLSPAARLGFAAGVGAAVGAAGWWDPALVGGGYATIREALALHHEIGVLLVLLAVRLVLTVASYGTGVAGGIFAPMLALGTLIGLTFGQLVGGVLIDVVPSPGVFAVAGMAAFFSATVRAPITGIILTIEMTGNFDLILVLLATCLAANAVAEVTGGRPIYETLLSRTLQREADAPAS